MCNPELWFVGSIWFITSSLKLICKPMNDINLKYFSCDFPLPDVSQFLVPAHQHLPSCLENIMHIFSYL